MRAGYAALALIVASTAAPAQEITPAEKTALDASREAKRAGRYLEAATELRPVAFDSAGRPKDNFAYQQWAEIQGLMTGEAPAGIEPAKPLAPELAAQLRTASLRDAIPEIVARAAKTRVVFLNEDHGAPRDRAFALEVARALRPLGYDVLAVETLGNDANAAKSAADMRKLAGDGYVRRDTGNYTADPVFADFLRQSLALGYRPVAYETTDFSPLPDVAAQIARREQAQADYLVARALKAYPHSKILVYVGFHHATEAPLLRDGTPVRWLATRLKMMTGIDPLTIEQTALGEHPSYGDAAAFAALAARVGNRSKFLVAEGKPFAVDDYAGAVDLQVVHPRTRHVGGRPDWLVAMRRTPTPIPAHLLPTKGTRLIQAFVASEAADAVPVDQVLVTAGQVPPMLMLPRARVRFAYQDTP